MAAVFFHNKVSRWSSTLLSFGKSFLRVFPNNKNKRLYDRFKTIVDTNGSHIGECYGVSISSILIYEEMTAINNNLIGSDAKYANAVPVSDIQNSLLDLGLELHEFIEAVHISQSMEEMAEQVKAHKNKYTDLIYAVYSFETTGDNPVSIKINSEGEGHELIGYKIGKEDDEYRVYVYDCNYSNDTQRYISFPLNSNGVPEGWSYTLQDEQGSAIPEITWKSSDRNAFISYSDDFSPIYKRLLSTVGIELLDADSSDEYEESSNLISSSSDNFTVTDNGIAAVCENGVFSNEENTDIISVVFSNYIPGTVHSFDNVFFYYSGNDTLKITNDSEAERVSFSMTDENSDIEIESDGKSVIELCSADNALSVSAAPSDNDKNVAFKYTADGGNVVIEISGEAYESVSASSESGSAELTVTGFDSSTVTVSVTQNEETDVIDSDKISDEFTVYVDENGEAVIESSNSYQLGDADNDGILTAADAAITLQKVLDADFSILVSESALDVDGDSVLMAADAAYILQKVLDADFKFPAEA